MFWFNRKPNYNSIAVERDFSDITLAGKVNIDSQSDNSFKGIAGASGNSIYLYYERPTSITKIDTSLKGLRHYKLNMTETSVNLIKKYFFIRADTTTVHIFCGNLSTIYSQAFNNDSVYSYELPYTFTRGVAFGDSAYVIRFLDLKIKDQLFGRYHIKDGALISEENISEINHDGGILSSGLLHYDFTNGVFVYVPYYTNRIKRFGYDLQTSSDFTTIERLNIPVGVTSVTSGNRETLTTDRPNPTIHGYSCINSGRLYMISRIHSAKEMNDKKANFSIVDIYEILSGRYLYSVKIPIVSGKIKDIIVVDRSLFVLTSDALFKWALLTNTN